MNLVFWIVLIIGIFIALAFVAALRIKVVFDSFNSDMHMTILWLKPFLKAEITMQDTTPQLHLYVFKKRLFSKSIRAKGRKSNSGMEYVKLADPRDVHVNAQYGFRDPFVTGIACGAINIASQFINIDSIEQKPDFVAENDYIYLDASAKVNLGSTLIRMFKFKTADNPKNTH